MKVLVAESEKTSREATIRFLEKVGWTVDAADGGQLCLRKLREGDYDLLLLDEGIDEDRLPGMLREIRRDFPGLPVAVFGDRDSLSRQVAEFAEGSLHFLRKPIEDGELRALGKLLGSGARAPGRSMDADPDAEDDPLDFSAEDDCMIPVLQTLRASAPSDVPILILGENGTGKTVLAHAVHHWSARAARAFVSVSCPNFSADLMESELFGHARGAFTGAVAAKRGKVELADGGTLFLDEIGDLPVSLQPRLLRLLQEGVFERVGEVSPRSADLRLISATNRDMDKAIHDGLFRKDLFYRLNVISVEIPPLRDRPKGLRRIASQYLDQFSKEHNREGLRFSEESLRALQAHDWPGNLRELRNVVLRAVILSQDEVITPDALFAGNGDDTPPVRVGGPHSLREIEKHHVRTLVEQSDSLQEASDILGINPATLYRKRKAWGQDGSQA